MAGLFLIKDHYGYPHLMSDLHIRNRIIRESKKSNYDWLAPASELLAVCNKSNFNKNYAKEIKLAIVRCYTSLMLDDISDEISYAYQAVLELKDYEDDKSVQKVRENFIKEYIQRGILWVGIGNFHETFHRAKKKWVSDKTKELLSDIKKLPSFDDLRTEFSGFVKRGEADGSILKKVLGFKISEAVDPWIGSYNPDNKQLDNVYSHKYTDDMEECNILDVNFSK